MKRVILLLFVLVLPGLAQIKADKITTNVFIKSYSQAGRVWLYEVDGKKVSIGSEEFAYLSKSKKVDYEKAIKHFEIKPDKNGKYKIKLKKKDSSTILDYDNIDKKTLLRLLKEDYLIYKKL